VAALPGILRRIYLFGSSVKPRCAPGAQAPARPPASRPRPACSACGRRRLPGRSRPHARRANASGDDDSLAGIRGPGL